MSSTGKARWTARPAFAVVLRYGLAIASVGAAIGTTLILRHYGFPPRFISHFTLIAIAITFWCAGTGPGALAFLLTCFCVNLMAKSNLLLPDFPLASFIVFYALFSLLMGWFSASRRKVQRLLSDTLNHLELRVAERTYELTRANEQLHTARAELERVTRVTIMGELAASIAHEINQPLAGVVTSANAGLNWLAANPPNLSKTRDALERILRDGTRGGEVLARIRAFLKRTPPAKTLVSVNQIARDVLALITGELRQHQIELSLDLASTVPAVLGDSVQLQQVLLNLIKNAVEAMSGIANGQRTLRIQSRLGEMEGRPAAVVEVSDTGVGFSGTDSSRLFEAFHTTKPQGMGMGLWISRSIIENHHGRLTVSSNHGPGATFVIMLPKASQEQA